MKIFGALRAVRFALAVSFGVAIFATTTFSTTTDAEASAARLHAIKRVEGMHER